MKTEFQNLHANKVCNACHGVIAIYEWYEQIHSFVRCEYCIELKREQINLILAEPKIGSDIILKDLK